MNKFASIAAVALVSIAGSASGDIGFSIGIGSSFGFCGSGIGFYSGISFGTGWGHSRHSYRWDDCGYGYGGYTGWYQPRSYGHGWGHSYRHYEPRRRSHGHYRGHSGSYNRWCDSGSESPAAVTVASTHDRPVNRTPAVTDTMAVDDRLAQAWELLEQGQANRAQGFFAMASSKSPDDAVAKLGFALASAEMGDVSRAEWSAKRAISVDEGELAGLTLGQNASVALADLLDAWQASGLALASELEAAMPGVVTLPADLAGLSQPRG